MSYGCFEVHCKQDEEKDKKITPWNPVRMSPSVCCFVQHMIENQNGEIPFTFVFVYPPHCSTFDQNNVVTELSHFFPFPLEKIEKTDKRELFSVYGVTYLQNLTNRTHTILHATCCYCGNYLCTKNHYDFHFIEIVQKKDVWNAFSSTILISDPFQHKVHFTSQMQTLIFMLDFVHRNCTVYNVTTKQVDGYFRFKPSINQKLKSVHQPKNPLPLSTHCFQSMWWEDMDWKKLPNIFPERMLTRYPLYQLYSAIDSFGNQSVSNNFLQENRNYYRSLKKKV